MRKSLFLCVLHVPLIIMAQMLALEFDWWVENPYYRRKTPLIIFGTRTLKNTFCWSVSCVRCQSAQRHDLHSPIHGSLSRISQNISSVKNIEIEKCTFAVNTNPTWVTHRMRFTLKYILWVKRLVNIIQKLKMSVGRSVCLLVSKITQTHSLFNKFLFNQQIYFSMIICLSCEVMSAGISRYIIAAVWCGAVRALLKSASLRTAARQWRYVPSIFISPG